jgi:hypothetical protein
MCCTDSRIDVGYVQCWWRQWLLCSTPEVSRSLQYGRIRQHAGCGPQDLELPLEFPKFL